jgi:hypothetical protein
MDAPGPVSALSSSALKWPHAASTETAMAKTRINRIECIVFSFQYSMIAFYTIGQNPSLALGFGYFLFHVKNRSEK